MTPEEIEAYLKSLEEKAAKSKKAGAPAAPGAPSTDIEKYLQDLEKKAIESKGGAKAATVPAAPPMTKAEVEKGAEEARKTMAGFELTQAFQEAEAERTNLYQEYYNQILSEGKPLSAEQINAEVMKRMNQDLGIVPPYGGGFGGPIIATSGMFAPSMTPENVPGATVPGGTENLTIGGMIDVLRPRSRVPTVTAKASDIFDDVSFERSLSSEQIPEEQKIQKRQAYEATKVAFDSIRKEFPNLSSNEVLDETLRQLNTLEDALSGRQGVDVVKPPEEKGASGLSAALSRQTTNVEIPRILSGQEAALKYLESQNKDVAREQRRQQLLAEQIDDVKITPQRAGPPIKTVVGKRNRTPEEVELMLNQEKPGELPWYVDSELRKKYIENPEEYFTYGPLGGKTYATGATTESPVFTLMRAAFAPLNAVAASKGWLLTSAYDIGTRQPEGGGVMAAREAARPEKYKGTGPAANIYSNIAEAGGAMKEIGEFFKYNPNETMRTLEPVGTAIGLGVDLLGLWDVGTIKLMTGAMKGGRAAQVAGKAAGLSGRALATEMLEKAAIGSVKGWFESLPLSGRVFERFPEFLNAGDVRMIYGAKAADEVMAANEFRKVYEDTYNAVLNGPIAQGNVYKASELAAREAKTAMSRLDMSGTNFAKTVNATPDESMYNLNNSVKRDMFGASQATYEASYDTSRIIDKIENLEYLNPSEVAKMKPYIMAASKNLEFKEALSKAFDDIAERTVKYGDPEETALLIARGQERTEKFKINDILSSVKSKLDKNGWQRFIGTLKKTAGFDAGVKVVDDAMSTAGLAGQDVIALTRNTFTDAKNAKNILKKFKQSDFYTKVVKPLNQLDQEKKLKIQIIPSPDGPIEVFKIDSVNQKFPINSTIEELYLGKIINGKLHDDIVESLNKGFIKVDDLRELSYGAVDAIALKELGGYTRKSLSEIGVTPPKNVVGGTAMRAVIAQERRALELTDELPVIVKRRIQKFKDSYFGVSEALPPSVKSVIQNSRNEVSKLDAKLADDFKRVKEDPAFRDTFDISIDASDQEIIIGLARGPKTELRNIEPPEEFIETSVYAPGQPKKKTVQNVLSVSESDSEAYARDLVESIIFSYEYSGTDDWFMPGFKFGKSALLRTNGYERLITRISRMSSKEIADILPTIFADANAIAKANVDIFRKARKGETLVVDSKFAMESLVTAYARKKGNEIIAKALIDANRDLPWIRESPLFQNAKSKMLIDIYYALMSKEAEIQKTTGKSWLRGLRERLIREGKFTTTTYTPEEIKNIIEELKVYPILEERRNMYIKWLEIGIPVDKVWKDLEYWGAGLISSSRLGKLRKPKDKAMEQFKKDIELIVKRFDPYTSNKFKNDLLVQELTKNFLEIADEIPDHVELFKSTGRITTDSMESTLAYIDALRANRMDINGFADPVLAQEIAKEIGSAPRYNDMLDELAKLTLEEKPGNVAFKASRIIRSVFDSYNTLYYTMMLTVNPRFHGVNNLTAPLQIAYSTGRAPLSDATNAYRNYQNAVNTILIGGNSAAAREMRDVVAATDRFGNSYTRGQLYDAAIKKGVFKSQQAAAVPTEMLQEMMELTGNRAPGLLKAISDSGKEFLGSPLAEFTDNVHRMTVVNDAIESGFSLEEALDLGRRSLYDYGELSAIERQISRTFFVFYNYYRSSVVQFMKNLVADPQRVIRSIKLGTKPTELMIGDQNAENLSFYYPQDYGVSRTVLKLDAAARYRDGKIILLPGLPHSDGLNLLASVLLNPAGFLFGPTVAGTGERVYDEGFISSRLGPISQTIGPLLFTPNALTQVKLAKNRIPPEHMAVYKMMPLTHTLVTELFDVKVQDAKPGEASLNGKVYAIDEMNFQKYKTMMLALQGGGLTRALGDWGKMIGGAPLVVGKDSMLVGTYPESLKEYLPTTVGLTTVTGAGVPEDVQRRAIEASIMQMQNRQKELEKKRVPQTPKLR